jgi:hypothetical protein
MLCHWMSFFLVLFNFFRLLVYEEEETIALLTKYPGNYGKMSRKLYN